MSLRDLLTQPDDFAGDPKGYAKNQAGHMAIGSGAALFLAWLSLPVWIAFAVYAAWELIQIAEYGAKESDGLEDFAFFTAGALLSIQVAALGALFLAAGIIRRTEETP